MHNAQQPSQTSECNRTWEVLEYEAHWVLGRRKWKRSKGGCWMWFRGKWSLRTSSRRALPSSDNYQSRTHNRVRMAICLASVPLWLLNIWHRLLAIHMFWVAVWVCEWLALAVKEIFVTFDFIRFVISLKAVHHRCPLEKDNHIIWHHGLEGRCLESNNNIYIAILKIELGIEQQYIHWG